VFAAATITMCSMLSDRPYMRDDYPRERTSVLTWLISAIVAGFVLQIFFKSPWLASRDELQNFLGLSIAGLKHGSAWTLLTHSFLHSPSFIFHIIGNVLALYFLGRELLPMLGAKRFIGLYGAATLVSALAWTAVHWRHGGNDQLIGATAAVDALFVVFACFFPNQEMNFLLFFLFPVTIKPKHIAFFLVGLDLFGLLFYEIPATGLPFGVTLASSAHLAGMLTGFVYYRFAHEARWLIGSPDRADIELPRWMRRRKKVAALPAPTFNVNVEPASPQDIRAEVDRILDKINSQGFGSLSPEEKRVLDDAKSLLSRR
jgi:membrane associated rhomboid family serine protease